MHGPLCACTHSSHTPKLCMYTNIDTALARTLAHTHIHNSTLTPMETQSYTIEFTLQFRHKFDHTLLQQCMNMKCGHIKSYIKQLFTILQYMTVGRLRKRGSEEMCFQGFFEGGVGLSASQFGREGIPDGGAIERERPCTKGFLGEAGD